MPWSNQSGGGGGWKGGSGGPWGSPPPGNQPPDLEELLRRSQDRLRSVLPGGGFGGRGILLAGLAVLLLWGASGFYRVEPDELGVELRFGAFEGAYKQPGLRYHLPWPIESALTPKVTTRNRTEVGVRTTDTLNRPVSMRDSSPDSLMLTGDENIVDINFSVFWVIKDAAAFLFNIQNPQSTVTAVSESAMREVIGRSNIQPILTEARQTTEAGVQDLIQRTLDDYGAGIMITQVQLQKVDPPAQVLDSFRDVQAARADQERLQNEAQTYANRIVPEARGENSRIVQTAEAYRQRSVAEARGQAERFTKVFEEYRKSPDITRQRLYLETMERVFHDMDKVIIDDGARGTGVVPYLPLDQLNRTPATPRPAQQPSGGQTR